MIQPIPAWEIADRDSQSGIFLLAGSLHESIELDDVIGVNARQIIANRLDLIRVRTNQFGHIRFVARTARGKF